MVVITVYFFYNVPILAGWLEEAPPQKNVFTPNSILHTNFNIFVPVDLAAHLLFLPLPLFC